MVLDDSGDLDFIDSAVKSSARKKTDSTSNEERVRFLKAYAADPNLSIENLASNLAIPQKSAETYVKKYIYYMIHTADDADAPRKVRLILNEDIKSPKDRITDLELKALAPLIDRYGDFDTVSTLRQKELNQSLMNNAQSNSFSSQMSLPSPHDFTGAHQGFAPTNGGTYAQADKPYASLSNSGRANLLRWVLERSPYIHNSKITPFIQLFETNEFKYMSSPDELYRYMCDYFGPAAGKLAFNQFKDMVNLYLSPSQGFGQNPYGGGGYGGTPGGWGNGGPNNGQDANYYQQLGVIPYGVNPRSPEAMQAVWDFKQEQKQRKSAEAMQENIKNYVNLKMMDIVDPNRQNGGQQSSNMNNWMQMAIMSGQMKITGIDPATGMPMLQPNDTSQNSLAVGMMNVMNNMYQNVMAANATTPKFMETILGNMFQKLNTQADPFALAISAKKLSDTFNPPGGNGMNGIEAAKILLARNKIDADKELTIQKMQFEHDKEMFERAKLDKQEENSHAQTNEIVKSIFSIGGQALVPLLSMFMGRNNPGMAAALAGGMGGQGGGMPDLSAMMGGMGGGFQGSGVPQETNFIPGAQTVNPFDIIGMQEQGNANPQWMAEPSDLYGPNTNMPPPQATYIPPTPQQQWQTFNPDQPQTQQPIQYPQQPNTGWHAATEQSNGWNAEAAIEDKTNFSPEDFKGKSIEQIEADLKQADQNQMVLNNFKDAARIAHQQKIFENQNQAVVNDVTQAIPQTMNDQILGQMPSNTPISTESPVTTADDKLIQSSQRFSDLDQAEDLLNTNLDGLNTIPEVPMNEPSKKDKPKPQRTSLDDAADVV